MDFSKLKEILLLTIAVVAISNLVQSVTDNSKVENEDSNNDFQSLLKRFKENEYLVSQLLGRVNELEASDKDNKLRIQTLEDYKENQQLQIVQLKDQLEIQRRRTSVLQRIIQQWRKTNNESPESDLKAQTVAVEDFDGVKTISHEDLSITEFEDQWRDGACAALVCRDNVQNRIRRAESEHPVAFTATVSNHHIEHAGDHQILVFDNVITNVGNAYNGNVGIFLAPVNGIYVFSVTLFAPSSVSFHANIVRNGQTLTWMYLDGSGTGGFDTASQTVALQLQKGDDVSIQHRDTDRTIFGYNYTLFTGFLLQEDFSAVVVG